MDLSVMSNDVGIDVRGNGCFAGAELREMRMFGQFESLPVAGDVFSVLGDVIRLNRTQTR